ncbi:aldehyde dehydrogenase (NADP(+)) [Ruegeria hyattellae]|uniref:aldehyde dehydrogenase (NADP(+)) n=1 Tax=Ruegeria hyattellae TaxID=3233337 RepID=UPI00355C7868
MNVTGQLLIAGTWRDASEGDGGFNAVDPAQNAAIEPQFQNAVMADVDAAVDAATDAFESYRQLSASARADFLDRIARELEALTEDIVARGISETGLPEVRLRGELGRTCGQLRIFATLLRRGDWARPVIDRADPDRSPLPKPDIRLSQIPLGPVVVFAASNFPLAFSTAGGDTASALAAGCPVIVKAHSAHPGTSEIVAEGIRRAAETLNMPKGIFSLIHGPGRTMGTALVEHPGIKAGGFTGSVGGGRALFDAANRRPEPIPFYGELGSTNPVFLLPGALNERAVQIAETFVGAAVMGAGQFCTSPGLLIALKGEGTDQFVAKASEAIAAQAAQTMLTPAISGSYKSGNAQRSDDANVELMAKSADVAANANQAQVYLFKVSGANFLADESLQHEIFGPSTLLIECTDEAELVQVAKSFYGHLTAAVHVADADDALTARIVPIINDKVGRLLFNGYGTGVEVCGSMSHGGPYPASTNVQTTSVGERAIDRFLRPISYQNTPDRFLPPELQNANPLGVMRLVDGKWTDAPL